MMKQTYEDFKYVMMDTGFLYLGAKYSYGELIENTEVPYKVCAIIERYILPEMGADTTLESHFYHMNKSEFCYKTFLQLKIKIKVSRIVTKKPFLGFLGKPKKVYATEMIPLTDFVEMSKEEKERAGIVIQEIVISKLGLMTFMV